MLRRARACKHACMLPRLLARAGIELPIISREDYAWHRSQDSGRRRFCMYRGRTQDQDAKDVDRWMKMEVIVVLLYAYRCHPCPCNSCMHNLLIIPFVYNVNLHIVCSLSQETLLATYLSIYPHTHSLSLPLYLIASILQ